MRFRLRTLLIILAIGPPLVAWLFWIGADLGLFNVDLDPITALAIAFWVLGGALFYTLVDSVTWLLRRPRQ